MILLGILIGIIVLGLAAQAALDKIRGQNVSLSRSWYLILGLALTIPTAFAPMALLRELRNPHPDIQTFSVPLTIAFGLGIYLLLRFFATRRDRLAARCS